VQILLEQVTEEATRNAFPISPEWLAARFPAGREGDVQLGETGELVVEAYRMGEDLHLSGSARGVLSLTCGRCLTRYREPIQEAFRLVLEPAGGRVPADPEAAEALAEDGLCLSDEPEVGWFQGTVIQLDRLAAEVIALGLPVQPVCREDCRGLCPRCGIDRNNESCSCTEVRPESPFAALQGLRDSLAGSGSKRGEGK
jgi:uncharacterized protein